MNRNRLQPVPRRASRLVAPLALGLIVLAAWSLRPAPQGPQPVPPLPVLVERVAAAAHRLPPLRLAGCLEAVDEVGVAFEVGGVVAAVAAEAGEVVARGQVLARLDSERWRAARDAVEAQSQAASARLAELRAGPRPEVLAQARAAVQAADERARLARSGADRHRLALLADAVSRQAEEAARREAEAATAAWRQAEATLAELVAGTRAEQVDAQAAVVAQLAAQRRQIDRDLADCELRAPFAGRIETRHVEVGSVVAAGAIAFDLVGERLRVRVGIPADLAADGIAALRDGLAATAAGAPLPLDVAAAVLLPRVDDRIRTVDLLVPLRGASGRRAGDRVDVELPAALRQGIAVPVAALRAGPRGLFRLQVVAGDGDVGPVENRDVRVAEWLGDRVLVTGGLAAGERLIVSGADHVLPGRRVQAEVR